MGKTWVGKPKSDALAVKTVNYNVLITWYYGVYFKMLKGQIIQKKFLLPQNSIKKTPRF